MMETLEKGVRILFFDFNLCQFCAVVGVKSWNGVVVESIECLPNIHRPWVQFPVP